MHTVTATTDAAARIELRRHTRQVLRQPASVAAHLARLDAALALPGAEPVQGALADLLMGLGATHSAVVRAAVQLAAPRLAEPVCRAFEHRARRTDDPVLAHRHGTAPEQLPRVTPLATRWSVLAIPSADVTTRARRVSADDSRALAAAVAPALGATDAAAIAAQEAFLHHCTTCRDALAYMLASRAARKAGVELSAAWQAVGAALEQPERPA